MQFDVTFGPRTQEGPHGHARQHPLTHARTQVHVHTPKVINKPWFFTRYLLVDFQYIKTIPFTKSSFPVLQDLLFYEERVGATSPFELDNTKEALKTAHEAVKVHPITPPSPSQTKIHQTQKRQHPVKVRKDHPCNHMKATAELIFLLLPLL